MNFLFDEKISGRGADSYKWDFFSTASHAPDLIPMWVADMDFRSPPEIIQAFQKRAAHGNPHNPTGGLQTSAVVIPDTDLRNRFFETMDMFQMRLETPVKSYCFAGGL